MTGAMSKYDRVVDAVNYRIGRVMMYGIFVMIAILLWSSISKTFFLPSLWTLEVAQFAMVAYYIMGGPYSIQLGSNVRMDLFYGAWSPRRKAWFDAFTVLFLIFYLLLFRIPETTGQVICRIPSISMTSQAIDPGGNQPGTETVVDIDD